MSKIRKSSDLPFLYNFEYDFHPLWNISHNCLEPLFEMIRNENELIVTVDLPCVLKKDDIKLSISEDSLEISATTNKELKWEKWGTVQKQVRFNSFKKIIQLPERVEPSKAKAKFSNGILKIILPRIHNKFSVKID